MSHLSADEKQRYDLLSREATRRPLSATEMQEWQGFGHRYARQLEDERQAYLARRNGQMEQFLAEKRAYDEAKDAARAAGKAFDREPVERDFVRWLHVKGIA